ncbi:MAG: putative addiction module CopG family antidote [Granulosicoccus sp.]|jgi:putative addiction module CopG family antidote
MNKPINLNVRVSGTLGEFVSSNIVETGEYGNASEYIRDLIRKDKAQTNQKAFDTLQAELQHAFSAPESSYIELSADDIISPVSY